MREFSFPFRKRDYNTNKSTNFAEKLKMTYACLLFSLRDMYNTPLQFLLETTRIVKNRKTFEKEEESSFPIRFGYLVIEARFSSERRITKRRRRGAREYWREKRKEMNKIEQSEARPFAFFAGM